jgi:predicted MPP superfamily phosphohydrolase
MSLIYGITLGNTIIKLLNNNGYFSRFAWCFDGFTITQISDVHSGSFDNPDKINYAIDLVNEQNSDMILFTGDIVNTDAKEMHPDRDFNRIKKHEFGKYCFGEPWLGEYVTWPSEKIKRFSSHKRLYGQIGFKLMLNEHTYIQKGSDKIALIGMRIA